VQRTYLALATLAAGAALACLQGLPLQANTVPSRAPLGQNQPTGQAEASEAQAALMLRLAAAGLQAAETTWGTTSSPTPPAPPPPPLHSGGDQSAGIVALEVVPYRP